MDSNKLKQDIISLINNKLENIASSKEDALFDLLIKEKIYSYWEKERDREKERQIIWYRNENERLYNLLVKAKELYPECKFQNCIYLMPGEKPGRKNYDE